MVVLDIAIVNVALPSIQVDLGFSQENLQWVISAYALVFGGFLLLGGRAADLLGRRRIFLVGVVVFTVSLAPRRPRLVGGVADRRARVPGARRGDHLAGRALDPLDDVRRRARAQHRARRLGRRRRLRRRGRRPARRHPHRRAQLGVDLLRQRPGRRRRVRAGAAPARREPRRAREDVRRPRRGARDRRPLAARLRDHAGGPGRLARRPRRSAFFATSLALLAGFVAWELRHPEPLMRFGILRIRTVSGANVAGFIMGTAMFSMFLMLTLYMQQVLGLLGDEDRRRLPRGRGHGDPLVGGRGAARHARRREAGARRSGWRRSPRASCTSRRSRSAAPTSATSCPASC